MERVNPARRLDQRLWFSLGLAAGLIILHQFLIQPSLLQLTSDAPVINVAGRQRMLSQKLVKEAFALIHAENSETRAVHHAELAATLQTWKEAHASLRTGDRSILSASSHNATIQRGYAEIEPYFQAMANAAETLLQDPDDEASHAALDTLLKNDREFLPRMHALVGLYEDETRWHVRQLQTLGLTIMILILGALMAIQFGIMRPQLNLFGREWERIEADYELLVESMTDGLVVFDPQGRVEFANRRFGVMVAQDVDQIVGQPASVFISDIDRRQFEILMREPKGDWGPIDFKLRSRRGNDVDTMISPRRIADSNGEFQGLLLVVTDVTSRKAIERRSRELQAELAHADRLKSMGAMAAALAHEINQPLGAISNFAEGCLQRLSGMLTDPTELLSPLQGILRASHRAGEIVRRTKTYTRRSPFHLATESINDLIHEVEELCRPEARRRCVSIESQLAADLPKVQVDGIQIQQVLTNLIENAFTALERVESFRRRIKVTSRQITEDLLEVSVSDTGPGVSAETSHSVFEPFVTTEANGTGLGLPIAQGIIESHGGRIWHESNGDGGAVFRFTLPLTPPYKIRGDGTWTIDKLERRFDQNAAFDQVQTGREIDTLNIEEVPSDATAVFPEMSHSLPRAN